MEKFTNYKNLKEISQSSNSKIYRAHDEANSRPVILKVFNKQHPSVDEVSRFYREYDLLGLFNNEGVIRAYGKSEIGGSPAIVLEDFGGESLKVLLKSTKLRLEEFLKLAIKITGIIGSIHRHNIIHKDINPANIIWNTKNGNVRIIDLGIATELSRETTSVKNPNVLEGTLSYISPEQTGRMNRSLDYRTDFYSLGVTFYWMLTGRLPFESEDLPQLIHSHIAIEPKPAHDRDRSVPEAVSQIIIKLMAKNAEDRYLSSHGIRADLDKCLKDLKKNDSISIFELATHDMSDRFEISQKLYGRDRELSTLMKAFERVNEGSSELILVSGFAGIGKSALINEIQRPVVKHRGYFFSGKFEQLKRDEPYNAIVQAFTALARQILGESEADIILWKEKILSALDPNGKILTDVIPLFELVIGKQPEVPELGAVESQNRFNLVFGEFIGALSGSEHPLVMFLDDLQWADSASLNLLKLFATESDLENLLMIGAYRHNETPDSHPLMLTVDEIKKTGTRINSIFLEPLKVEHVHQLLSDTLKSQDEGLKNIAEILIRKSGGNPFFVNEFIKSLYGEHLLVFNFPDGWSWKTEEIEKRQATDNVVELMAEKISDLPEGSRDVLMLASCLGNTFDRETLATVAEHSGDDILEALKEPLNKGMLNLIDNVYSFSHDRVLEASYSLLPVKERIQQHHRIGNIVLNQTDPGRIEENIFYIVNQLNAGIELVSSEIEKHKLIELNLKAGKKALASNAYTSALNYLKTGIKLLGKDPWQEKYRVTLELHENAVAASDLSGLFDEMDRFAEAIFSHAKTFLDTIKTYEMLIFSLNSRNQIKESLNVGRKALKKLGIRYPENPGMLQILKSILSVKFKLLGKPLDKLLELPEMVNPHKRAIMYILPGFGSSAYSSIPELMPIIVADTVKLSVKYGNSSYSPFAWAALGMIHCSALGEIDKGYEYGKFALRLLEKFNFKDNLCDAMFIFWCFINHWKKPIRDSFEPYLDIYKTGLEIGNFPFAAVSVNAYSCNLLYAGVELKTVEREFTRYTEAIKKLNNLTILNLQKIQYQTVLNLQGKNDNPSVISGTVYNCEEMLPIHNEVRDTAALFAFYYFSLNLNYLFENYEKAFECLELSIEYEGSATGSPYIPLVNFYDSLVHLALCGDKKKSQTREHLRRVARNQKKMKKWAHHSPDNYLHKYHLIEAETARLKDKEQKARGHYDNAIQLARKNKFIQEEALASELAAKFWLDLKEEKIASIYLTDALHLYQRWGGMAKVKHLEKKYKNLLNIYSNRTGTTGATVSTGTSSTSSTESIDLVTVIKTSQTLSSEIDLSNLLKEIMRLSIENAGAQRGFLILKNEEDSKLYIEAEGDSKNNISVLQSVPVDESSGLARVVVRYVRRTGESVVLNNAHSEGEFTSDPYIIKNRVRSLLCTPVTHKGKTQGLLYLENNITSSVFIPERIEVLQLISSQAAISIENARLLIDREKALDLQTKMANSFSRFVPREFLTFLNKKSITEVELGNQVQKQMTVLFSDIRSFASLSEKMTPQENFNFLNSYLKRIGPVIRSHKGFIDKYIGDAVMALFPDAPEDAVNAALMMQHDTLQYNKHRKASGYDEIKTGIGLHYGNLMLGTIGEENRMEGTVISDDVNLSSRIESLTKHYGSQILVSDTLFEKLSDKTKYTYRIIDTVIVKGRSEPVTLIDIFDEQTCKNYSLKISTNSRLAEAIKLYREKSISEALAIFQELSAEARGADEVFEIYIKRCKFLLVHGIPEDWNGIEKLENK